VLFWLKEHLSRNQFLIFSGILVGITAGLAGVLLKTLVHYIHYLITEKVHLEYQSLFYIVFPFLGITLTTLIVIYFYKGQARKGLSAILYEIARNSSIVAKVKMYSQIIQSAVTVGLGGSAGLESPIAVTGAAIGSNFAQAYHLGYRERTLLLASGATAGIASAFNAPIAGMIFAFEILLTGVIFSDFIPLVVAAVCGSLVSKILLQEDVLFMFHSRESFDYHNIVFYIALGLITGLYARYFLLCSRRVEHFFHRLKLGKLQQAMLGGSILSVLCVLFPPLFGEGYEAVKALNNGQAQLLVDHSLFRYLSPGEWTIVIFLLLVCLLKAFATSATIFSGGNGGNFAPSLFAGGTVGYLFAQVCLLLGFHNAPVANLVLVGMAGVMSGVLYAPLTAIFLIAESSHGYDLFIPLMIVSVIAHLMARWFSPISPELKALADDGKILTREHDRNLLNSMSIAPLVDRQTEFLSPDSDPADLLAVIAHSKKNIFAVINEAQQLQGVVTLDDIRPLLFDRNQIHELQIQQVIKAPPYLVHLDDGMAETLARFDQTATWHLPVADHQGRFLGFLSKSTILTAYRQLLQEYS